MNIQRLMALTVLMGTAGGAQGQAAPAWTASIARDSVLEALVTEALDRNPGLAGHEATARAAALRVRPAGTLPDPMFTTGVMDLTLPHLAISSGDFTEVDGELMQAVPWPGTLSARAAVAQASAAGTRAEASEVRRDVAAGMAAAYYRLRYAVTALETAGQQRALLDAAVQLSTTRYETGMAPQSDPLQARLAQDRLRAETYALESERTAALAAVNTLRNRTPTESVAVTPLDLAAVRTMAVSLPPPDSLIRVALAAHPRIAARQAMVDQATQMIRAARFDGRPAFTIMARYGYRPPVADVTLPGFFSAAVGVDLPIWAGRNQHRLADAARADSSAAEAGLHDAQAQLGQDITETAARVEAAQQRLALLEDGVLPTARSTVESVLRSYQVGRAEFLTLLSVEDALYQAELEAVAVGADYETQLAMLRQLTAEESAP